MGRRLSKREHYQTVFNDKLIKHLFRDKLERLRR